MINSLLKLAFLAVIANATWHVFVPYQACVRFKDAVHAASLADFERPEEEQKARVLSLANQFDIPLTADDFTLRRENNHTIIEGSYTQPIELVPTFVYPWTFTWHVDTFYVRPPKLDGLTNPR